MKNRSIRNMGKYNGNQEEIQHMKATGIVRRIDDLGRIVIPKEIRKTLKIREGDPLEIFTDREGMVVLKKYSPVGGFGTAVAQYAQSLAESLGCTVCITDNDTVIAVAGAGKKQMEENYVTEQLREVISERKQVFAEEESKEFCKITVEDPQFCEEVITPVISDGDAVGAIIFLNREEEQKFGKAELKIARATARFLGCQLT